MRLTAEQQVLFADWIRQKMEHRSCQLCKSNHWKMGELLPLTNGATLDELDASAQPGMVQLICQNCANVLLFDVRRIKGWQQHDTSRSAIM